MHDIALLGTQGRDAARSWLQAGADGGGWGTGLAAQLAAACSVVGVCSSALRLCCSLLAVEYVCGAGSSLLLVASHERERELRRVSLLTAVHGICVCNGGCGQSCFRATQTSRFLASLSLFFHVEIDSKSDIALL